MAKGRAITKKDIDQMAIGDVLYGGGLEVRRNMKGVSFYSNIRVKGHTTRELIGKTETGMNLTKAKDALTTLRTSQRPGSDHKNSLYETTFKIAAQKYLEILEESDGKNQRQKQQQLRDHLVPFFGSKRVF